VDERDLNVAVPVGAPLDGRQGLWEPLGVREVLSRALGGCGVLRMGRAPSGQGPGLVLMTPAGAANSDAYLTRVSGDRLETQLYVRILGGRY
jgi:hypothetical protein